MFTTLPEVGTEAPALKARSTVNLAYISSPTLPPGLGILKCPPAAPWVLGTPWRSHLTPSGLVPAAGCHQAPVADRRTAPGTHMASGVDAHQAAGIPTGPGHLDSDGWPASSWSTGARGCPVDPGSGRGPAPPRPWLTGRHLTARPSWTWEWEPQPDNTKVRITAPNFANRETHQRPVPIPATP